VPASLPPMPFDRASSHSSWLRCLVSALTFMVPPQAVDTALEMILRMSCDIELQNMEIE